LSSWEEKAVTSVSSVPQNAIVDARIEANDQCLLVQAEVWRAVAEAVRSETSLSLSHQAQRIASAFPASGYSRQDIKDALVFAAVDAGAVVDIAPPARADVLIEVKSLIRAAGRLRARKNGGAKKQPLSVGAPLQATA
jgi:hypothetical protein